MKAYVFFLVHCHSRKQNVTVLVLSSINQQQHWVETCHWKVNSKFVTTMGRKGFYWNGVEKTSIQDWNKETISTAQQRKCIILNIILFFSPVVRRACSSRKIWLPKFSYFFSLVFNDLNLKSKLKNFMTIVVMSLSFLIWYIVFFWILSSSIFCRHHHQHGRRQVQIGGNKELYCGTFSKCFKLAFLEMDLCSQLSLPFFFPQPLDSNYRL